MSVELKPCPFCGSINIALMNWHDFNRETFESNGVKHFAKCAGCWARIDDQRSKHDAIEKWNTRSYSEDADRSLKP
jgi:Lar family restriction alleviation protein